MVDEHYQSHVHCSSRGGKSFAAYQSTLILDASLPEYTASPSQLLSPTYTALPRTHEYRLALNPRLRLHGPPLSFVKRTKSGNVSMRLIDQDDCVALPVYGLGAPVQGMVEINKTEGITSVEVQVSYLDRSGMFTSAPSGRGYPQAGRSSGEWNLYP